MERFDGKLLGEMTAYSLNSYGFNNKEYAMGICRAHRTSQQSWARLVVDTCKMMAEQSYDERNEGAHQLAVAVAELSKQIPLPFV